ncbi:MAG TPA: alpha/beta fold hydrolase [Thermoanaerobaculia bacterium]|nr:alpha/beta fold hydrolase [Thermoanaerobaculia bacterium]
MSAFAAAFLALLAGLPSSPSLELKPCRLLDFDREVRCGTYEVFENRSAGTGRKIPLRVVVIPASPASGTPVEPDPVLYFEGGPGGSAVDSGPGLTEEFAEALRHRDLVLVDIRGTGGSDPLFCPRAEDTTTNPARARRCREILARDHDLAQYTTDNIVADVDEVRAALGYGKVNLLGASYGSRAALVYLRRHPEAVRTVHLHAVLPMDARVPQSLAAHTQTAFEKMAAACAAEPGCRAAFPDPVGDLEAVLKRLAKPVKVTLRDDNGKKWKMRLSRDAATRTVRYLLYRPAGARVVPLLLRRAASGDLEPLAQTAHDIASAMLTAPAGLYLSVTCAEDVAFMDLEEATRLAKGTFMGDLRARQQLAACAEWPAAKIPASFLEPVRSSVPVLIYAGENDPAMPIEWAERVAATLPESRVLVVPGGAHVFYGLPGVECLDRVYSDFLTHGSSGKATGGLDIESCRKSIKPLPFATSFE